MSKKFGAKSKIEDGEMMIMILFRFIKIELRSSKNPDDPILHFLKSCRVSQKRSSFYSFLKGTFFHSKQKAPGGHKKDRQHKSTVGASYFAVF